MVTNMATALPQVKAGRLKGLAVTGTQRVPDVAELPTAMEAGLAGYEYTTWYALLLPARTPDAVVARVHLDVVDAIRGRACRERFATQGLDVIGTSVQEFASYLRTEVARWSGVVQVVGLSAN